MTVGALGEVVAAGLGLRVEVRADPTGRGFGGLAGLALRDNPRRAHLVVSRVLAKHIPVAGADVLAASADLADLVRPLSGPAPLVLGFCETATALGWQVADALGAASYAHSTRRPGPALVGFREEHSHAADHALQLDAAVLTDPRPLVLVDDELTSGATALATIEALQALWPREDHVVAALLDLRPEADRATCTRRAERLGTRVRFVSLLDAVLHVPGDILQRAGQVRRSLPTAAAQPPHPEARVAEHRGALPQPATARQARSPEERARLREEVAALADRLPLAGPRTLVLGTEELLQPAVLLGAALGGGALVQSSTRSPVVAADLPGYAVRRALTTPCPDDPPRLTRVHNLADPRQDSPQAYDDVVVLVDTPAAAARPLAEALRPWATAAVHVVGC